MRRTRAVVVGIALLSGAAVGQVQESALDVHLREHPGALEEGSLGPLEARVLQALTPEQAEAYGNGSDPSAIVLASGETLADFMATLLAGGAGLVYVPLDACRAFQTLGTAAGPFAADESREYLVRGADLSAQGGSATGCMVPAEAVAVVMHFRTVLLAQGVAGRLRVKQAGGVPLAQIVIEYVRQGDLGRRNAGMSVVGLCEGTCASGEIEVTSEAVPANIWGTVIGYYRPLVAADAPSVGDADTLDGLDSTDFALVTHTHDGGDIISGVVGEPFIDSQIARDDEVLPTVLANDGSGSTLDADLLDGKQLTAFRPRPANVILVDPTNGDYATIQGALDDIGAGLPAATSANRYLIRVGAGEYAEQVTMKPFVDIEGKGEKVTTIRAVAGGQTLLGASDAELRHVKVVMEVAGGQASAVAIRNDGGATGGGSATLTYVTAAATGGTVENTGIVNDNAAAPVLDHVAAAAGAAAAGLGPVVAGVVVVTDIGVVNQNGATPILRDSRLAGTSSAIENRDTATARIANTELAGDADVMAPAVQSSYMCVRAYAAGTLTRLNEECNPNTPPMATDDSYATLGNTLLEVDLVMASGAPAVVGPDGGPLYADVLDNDTDAETPAGLSAAVVPGTVTAGALVAMNADGSFSYTPPVGFTGTDSFDYEVTDAGGLMDTGTVEVTVAQMIWYVDNDNGGMADGRSATPFTSLAPIDTGGADDMKDGSGDTIFVFDGTGNTSGGILLEAAQVLHGHEIALEPAGFDYAGGGALVAASTAPTIEDTGGDVIELASGTTVRGLDIAATAGRAVFGSAVAGATLDRVGTTGAGSGTGVRFDNATGAITMSDLDVASSTGPGIDIQGGSATFTFDSPSSVTSPSGAGLNVSGGTAQITYSGSITQAGSFPAVSITDHSNGVGSGITFQTGAITASNGTGLQFSNADGTYTFSGPTTLSGGDAGIDILNGSAGTFSFGAATAITNPSGIGVNLDSSPGGGFTYNGTISQSNAAAAVRINAKSGGAATFTGSITANTGAANGIDLTSNSGSVVTFSGLLDIDTTIGTGFSATGGGTVQATNAGNTVNTVGTGAVGNGIGVNIGAEIGALGVTFGSVNVGSLGKANSGILLSNTGNTGGVFSVPGGTIQNTTQRGFSAANVDGTVDIGASLENDGGRTVEITSGSAGAITFRGAIDENAQGVDIHSNGSGGTFTFQGGVSIGTIGSAIGLRAFSGGTLNICADTNCSAAGGSPVINTIDTATGGTGIGISIDSVTIGSEAVTFRSISSDGGTGINLDTTGAGAFTVTGIDGPCGNTALALDCDGGTIGGFQDDAIRLENTDGPVSISNVLVQDIGDTSVAAPGHHGVDGRQVDGGLTLDNVLIRRVTDSAVHGEAAGGGSTTWAGLTITDSKLENSNRFHLAGLADGGATDEAMVTVEGISGTVVISRNDFDDGPGFINLFTAASGNVDITVQSNTFNDGRKDLAGVPSVGSSGVRVNTTGAIDAAIRIGDPGGAGGNTFVDPGTDASVFIGGFSAADNANVDLVIANNSVTVSDHTSPPGLCVTLPTCAFDFPNGGIGIESRGGGTFEAIISNNLLTETQNSGGLSTGSIRVDVSGDDTEVIVRDNTVVRAWDGPLFIRADNADGNGARGFLLVRDNAYVAGLIGVPGSGDDLDVLGFANSPAPFLPNRFQVRNGAVLDLTVINDDMVSHDTFSNPGFDSLDMRINGDAVGGTSSVFNVLIQDTEAPEDFLLRNDDSGADGTDSELNLSRGLSADPAATDITATQAESVLDDNNNTTGGGASNASVPFSGVNIVTTMPTLPVVSPP